MRKAVLIKAVPVKVVLIEACGAASQSATLGQEDREAMCRPMVPNLIETFLIKAVLIKANLLKAALTKVALIKAVLIKVVLIKAVPVKVALIEAVLIKQS